jgi:hypothetical protein
MTLYSDCIHTINTKTQKIQHTGVPLPGVQLSPCAIQELMGSAVGIAEGWAVGLAVGDEVGSTLGIAVGDAVGLAVGDAVPFLLLPPLTGLAGLTGLTGLAGMGAAPPFRARSAET